MIELTGLKKSGPDRPPEQIERELEEFHQGVPSLKKPIRSLDFDKGIEELLKPVGIFSRGDKAIDGGYRGSRWPERCPDFSD